MDDGHTLERFKLHTTLVRDMSLVFDHDRTILAMTLLPEPSFPSLQSLQIRILNDDPTLLRKLLMTFLHSPLQRINVDFGSASANSDSFIIVPSRISQVTGGLVHLCLTSSSTMTPQTYGEVAQAITANPRLRDLVVTDTGSTYQVAFEAASHLPHLKSVSFISDFVRNDGPAVQTVCGFPSLVAFKADIDVRSIPNLVRSFAPDTFQELTLYAHYPSNLSTAVDLNEISRLSHLKRFDFQLHHTQNGWTQVVRPLLACPRIEFMSLFQAKLSSELDDGTIRAMGRAWPSLTVLRLVDSGSEFGPTATLTGRTCLAELCPSLKELKIAVDASGLPRDVEFGAIGKAVEKLDLSGSFTDDREEEIASFIVQMWPNHQNKSQRGYGSHSRARDRWSRIWEIANICVSGNWYVP